MWKKVGYILVTLLCTTCDLMAGPDGKWTLTERAPGKPPVQLAYEWDHAHGRSSLTFRKGDQVQSVALDENGSTIEWRKPEMVLSRGKGGFHAVFASGKKKEIEDKGLPWIQVLPQLSMFVLSKENRFRFQAYPDRLDSALKAQTFTVFVATKTERALIKLPIGDAECWKVHVTFDDIRSIFWGGDYWFRVTDGLLVRFEELRGRPGTTPTVGLVEWVRP